MLPKIGSQVYIQSYKHDGSLHRTWSKGLVIDADETKYVVVTNKTWVIEADGRKWFTREPAICFFYTDRWYNVISMMRKTGVYYYCNLASPSLYDGEAIKNIDYDLDVKIYPNGGYDILDQDEFEEHASHMGYGEDVIDVVERSLDQLLNVIEEKKSPFNAEDIDRYFQLYLLMIRKQ
jgi:protein associated with RNAse G/E